jgi:hypothetical protein
MLLSNAEKLSRQFSSFPRAISLLGVRSGVNRADVKKEQLLLLYNISPKPL